MQTSHSKCELRPYQSTAKTSIAKKISSGIRKICFQCATGSGKTVLFTAIADSYIARSDKDVLIVVHRKELLRQTRKVIQCQQIVAGMRYVPKARVYVGMIESTMRRLPDNIGLVIIDECHIASFNKIIAQFPTQYIIGFSATPLSNNKRKPVNMFYDDIVCGIDIPELIAEGYLAQNITYAPRDIVDRAALTIKNGEFDEHKMGDAYSAPRYITSTVNAYEKWGKGSKTIIFNCNIEHSRAVNNAFILAGYDSRHLDSTMPPYERLRILQWFEHTPGAILNNVAILTAGFDCPTIETVIFNKATLSMPLWLQCTGRGSRITPEKSAFTIIDMGGNAIEHGDWNESRDWSAIFHNPPKARDKKGAPSVKYCPGCDAIISVNCHKCPFCGYIFPTKDAAPEGMIDEFVMITKGIDVRKVIERNKEKKEYFAFYEIGRRLAKKAGDTDPEIVLERYNQPAAEWAAEKNKKYNDWHKKIAREHLFTELNLIKKHGIRPLTRLEFNREIS